MPDDEPEVQTPGYTGPERRATDPEVLQSQRRYAATTFWAGTGMLAFTVVLPILGVLLNAGVQLGGWGCEPAVNITTCTAVCRQVELDSPWPLLVGSGVACALYFVSVAFAQRAVGEHGLGFIGRLTERLPGFLGGKRDG